MKNQNIVIIVVLVIISLLCMVMAWAMFQNLKNSEAEFNRTKAELISRNLDLKERIDNLQSLMLQKDEEVSKSTLELADKTSMISFLEKEKKSIKSELIELRKQTKELQSTHSSQVETLIKENEFLSKRIEELEKQTPVESLKKALSEEDEKKVRKILEGVGYEAKMVGSGNAVDLDRVVVKEGIMPVDIEIENTSDQSLIPLEKLGKVLSVDRENNLLVIDMGRQDGVEEGQQCIILEGNKEIASAEIISTRYRISAAVIEHIRYGFNINDIKKDNDALVLKK